MISSRPICHNVPLGSMSALLCTSRPLCRTCPINTISALLCPRRLLIWVCPGCVLSTSKQMQPSTEATRVDLSSTCKARYKSEITCLSTTSKDISMTCILQHGQWITCCPAEVFKDACRNMYEHQCLCVSMNVASAGGSCFAVQCIGSCTHNRRTGFAVAEAHRMLSPLC